MIPCVPRLFNRIQDKVFATAKGNKVKAWLLKKALAAKEREVAAGIFRNNGFWDKLVFKSVREGMGGNLRIIVVGSAPLAPNTLTFMRCALGCLVCIHSALHTSELFEQGIAQRRRELLLKSTPLYLEEVLALRKRTARTCSFPGLTDFVRRVLTDDFPSLSHTQICEGYGQTESVCPCTMTFPGDPATGHVGPPLASAYVKVVDVPEMEYYAREGSGEVCVKGPLVFQGYFNDPIKTAEVIDNEGWLHTGDIGTWLENGTLRIVDRKKHIFKMSQGKRLLSGACSGLLANSFPTN